MNKITNYIEHSKKISQIYEEYLKILPGGSFANIFMLLHNTNLTLEEREKNLENLKPLIEKLKILFKIKIQEMNKLSNLLGFNNYLEYFLASNNIPEKSFQSFLENIDAYISLVHQDYPSTKISEKVTDWSLLNIPFPTALFFLPNNLNLPNEVLDLISGYYSRIAKYRNRIQIEFKKGASLSGNAKYDAYKNIVTISVSEGLVEQFKTLVLVQQLGKAMDILDCADNKVSPYDIPKYLQDYSAIEFTHEFIKRAMSKKDQDYTRYNLLNVLVDTVFEIDIFMNDEQDYDKAYARAIKRCYPMTNHVENPLYVSRNMIVLNSLGTLNSNMVNVELYLKDAKEL